MEGAEEAVRQRTCEPRRVSWWDVQAGSLRVFGEVKWGWT